MADSSQQDGSIPLSLRHPKRRRVPPGEVSVNEDLKRDKMLWRQECYEKMVRERGQSGVSGMTNLRVVPVPPMSKVRASPVSSSGPMGFPVSSLASSSFVRKSR